MLKHDYADVNGIRLHYATAGQGKLIMFAHGFPEFWYAWKDQLAEFGRDYQAVALDMRGYNLSSKPADIDQYRMKYLIEDFRALAGHLGHRKFVLVGHDWGGVVAWAFALRYPELLEKLVIVNAPHPTVFERELRENPAQQKASEYILKYRRPGIEGVLAAKNFARLVDTVLTDGSQAGFFGEEDRKAYVEAWSQPGALTGGLNYYRASRLGPSGAANGEETSNLTTDLGSLVVKVPTLVIWGEKDWALLTGNLDGLEQYVPDLIIKRIPDGSHWVVHEKPALVNACIREFVEG